MNIRNYLLMNNLNFSKIKIQLLLMALFFSVTTLATPVLGQPITTSIPADILHLTVSDALPIALDSNKELIDGEIVIESLETLKIAEDRISLQGVVLGNNLSLNTNIGGQVIKLKLGSLRLPVSCDLFLRFDTQQKKLFVTPEFPPRTTAKNGAQEDPLASLLAGLGGKEYPVNFGSMEPFVLKIGKKNVPFNMEPVGVATSVGALVLQLMPKAIK